MVRTLGEVTVEGREGFRTQKCAELLGLLVRPSGKPLHRELLGELLWPGVEPRLQRNRLRYELHCLRRLVPDAWLQTSGHTLVRLSAPSDYSTFEQEARRALALGGAAQRIPALELALGHYGGEFMPGHYVDWVLQERLRLESLHDMLLCRLSADYQVLGKPELTLYWSAKRL